MRNPEALATALGMLSCPHVTRRAKSSPLPKGVTFLLEIAAGERDALSEASAITGKTEATLRKAAGFFIEQVLLTQNADNYRILGSEPQSTDASLRRHMALIMRWLHPDFGSSAALNSSLDKSIYAHRVTQAWEAIKTKERRAEYDASLVLKMSSARRTSLFAPPLFDNSIAIDRGRHKKARSHRRSSLLKRFLVLLAGRP